MASAATRQHAEWLGLVEISGPWLTLPVLDRTLPQGLEPTDPDAVARLRLARAELADDPRLQNTFIRWVLTDLLGLGPMLVEGPAIASTLVGYAPESGEEIRPTMVVTEPATGQARLLITTWPSGAKLDRAGRDAGWVASPIERTATLCRATGVRLGLATNGDRWALVAAPRGTPAGVATFDSDLWLEERLTLDAFVTLLSARRFFSVAADQTLEAMLAASADAQQEITDTLGGQVRAAVELLVDALGRADRDAGGRLLGPVPVEEIYAGAVTALMRMIFLLAAEERGLLLLGDAGYDSAYAVSTLHGQLVEDARRLTEDTLERRSAAWCRLLATFRLVHGGVQHENLRLPAYGGALFDPDRYPFLEGRTDGQPVETSEPPPVDDRTVLHLLDALVVLRRKGGSAQRLSYRGLDVEQIGHVYEGLLDHTAVRSSEPALGLRGKKEPDRALALIEEEASRGEEHLASWLASETGLTVRSVEQELGRQFDLEQHGRLLAACDNDPILAGRVARYTGLCRTDLRGLPVVFVADSLYVTSALDRRSTGTYYTPRSLAEEMVRHTLDALCHRPGPAEGAAEDDWVLRPADELLGLKVLDMAMGSGAFLVAACRYLADKVVAAWSTYGGPDDLPADPDERTVVARRLVTDRCLYGVDKNPMAVEMAKVSLWLITLAKGRPFTFLDHSLRCGDSLLGVVSAEQLAAFHPNPTMGRALFGTLEGHVADAVGPAIQRAVRLRCELESFAVVDPRDAAEKTRLLDEAEWATADLRVVGDVLAGAMLSTAGRGEDDLDERLAGVAGEVAAAFDPVRPEWDRAMKLVALQEQAGQWLEPTLRFGRRRPFHWCLEFPEIFDAGRFDAVVGNPPFQGGKKVSGEVGTDYREYLVDQVASGRKGNTDLVTFFFLRAAAVGRAVGLLATNTIAQGDSREVGLDWLTANGWAITRAWKSRPWPGDASLEIAQVWLHQGTWRGSLMLEGADAAGITPALDAASRAAGAPFRLASKKAAFIGSFVNGDGFVLPPWEAQSLLDADSRNADVIFPYLNGEDLNSRPDCSASRWVINFFDWSLERAEQYPVCLSILKERVKPHRDTVNRDAHRRYWWHYGDKRSLLYETIKDLDRVLAIALTSKTVATAFSPTGIIFSHATAVFAYYDDAHFGLLSSAFHYWWAVRRASTMRTDVRYTPSDCFETLPQPSLTLAVDKAGGELDAHRRQLMLDRWEGLTKTYNRVHDPADSATDIAELRRLHVELDHAVAAAYGWEDLTLDHGFHETRQGVRYTVGPVTRTEILDRLLELNHARYADEVRRGLHQPKRSQPGRRGRCDGSFDFG